MRGKIWRQGRNKPLSGKYVSLGLGFLYSLKDCEDLLMAKKLTYEELEQRVQELERTVRYSPLSRQKLMFFKVYF
jgi:predicted DNA-binding ArsR family transcriptional regulator